MAAEDPAGLEAASRANFRISAINDTLMVRPRPFSAHRRLACVSGHLSRVARASDIERHAAQGVDIDKLEQLVALMEYWDANE